MQARKRVGRQKPWRRAAGLDARRALRVGPGIVHRVAPWPKTLRRALGAAGALAVIGLGLAGSLQAADSPETPCSVCRVWDGAMAGVPEEAVSLEARPLENGVALRAISTDPATQRALWEVSWKRQVLLAELQDGNPVPLCTVCRANVAAFETLRIDMLRLPNGVLLLYTSTDPQVVHRLHTLIAAPAKPL